jgi:hypothetical protein
LSQDNILDLGKRVSKNPITASNGERAQTNSLIIPAFDGACQQIKSKDASSHKQRNIDFSPKYVDQRCPQLNDSILGRRISSTAKYGTFGCSGCPFIIYRALIDNDAAG